MQMLQGEERRSLSPTPHSCGHCSTQPPSHWGRQSCRVWAQLAGLRAWHSPREMKPDTRSEVNPANVYSPRFSHRSQPRGLHILFHKDGSKTPKWLFFQVSKRCPNSDFSVGLEPENEWCALVNQTKTIWRELPSFIPSFTRSPQCYSLNSSRGQGPKKENELGPPPSGGSGLREAKTHSLQRKERMSHQSGQSCRKTAT